MIKKYYSYKRRLIIKNRYLIPQGKPRIRGRAQNVSMLLNGDDILQGIKAGKETIFAGYGPKTKVLIKINLNSSLPYPASVSLKMLETISTCLIELGVQNICIADSSGLKHIPTSSVMRKKGLKKFKNHKVKIKSMDLCRWQKVPVTGIHFKEIIIPRMVAGYDKIINLSNLKAHTLAEFSAATKNLVGFMHPYQRFALHRDYLIERIAEIPLAIEPDLNIVDARSIFIDGGPDEGTVFDADSVIIESSLHNADIKAYELLIEKRRQNGLIGLSDTPENNPFFIHSKIISGGSQ